MSVPPLVGRARAPVGGTLYLLVELYFPVDMHERDALLGQHFDGDELAGMAAPIDYDTAGVQDDAIWVAAKADARVFAPFRESDSEYLGYESYVLPRDLIDRLTWRELSPREVEQRESPGSRPDIAKPSC